MTEEEKDAIIQKHVEELRERRESYKQRNFPDGIIEKSKAHSLLSANFTELDSKVIALEITDHYDGTLAGSLLLEGDSEKHLFSFSVENFLEEKGLVLEGKEDDYDDYIESRFFFVYEGLEVDSNKILGYITEDCPHSFRELVELRTKPQLYPSFIPLTYKNV